MPDLAGWRRERMPEMPDVAFLELAPDWIQIGEQEPRGLETIRIDGRLRNRELERDRPGAGTERP